MKSSVLCQTFTASGSSSCLPDPIAFLLDDSFQSSLGKLSREEQKAAKLAAFELQINPVNPGLQCHRLDNIKDSNFWSARASRDILDRGSHGQRHP
jgi:ABC-type cobalamin transport system ATPase subunit